MGRGPQVTNEIWQKVKTMQDAGLKTKIIADILGYSVPTICMINRSNSLEHYLQIRKINKGNQSKKKPVEEPKETAYEEITNLAMNYHLNRIYSEICNTNIQLKKIAGLLNDLVNELK